MEKNANTSSNDSCIHQNNNNMPWNLREMSWKLKCLSSLNLFLLVERARGWILVFKTRICICDLDRFYSRARAGPGPNMSAWIIKWIYEKCNDFNMIRLKCSWEQPIKLSHSIKIAKAPELRHGKNNSNRQTKNLMEFFFLSFSLSKFLFRSQNTVNVVNQRDGLFRALSVSHNN